MNNKSLRLKPCSGLRCKELIPQSTKGAYCNKCRKEKQRENEKLYQNKDARKVYDSNRWKKARHRALLKEPFCMLCKEFGRYTLAKEVHHLLVKVIDGNDETHYNDDNLVGVCHKCHDALEPLVGNVQAMLDGIEDGSLDWSK